MSVSSAWRAASLAVLMFAGLAGCDYLERTSKVNEETEAHYIDGVTAKKLQDFDGAILHFENALKANPNSGSAHRELALLYDYYKNRHLRALYHYERFSELRTNEVNQLIRDRVFHCRVMVARDNFETLERTQVRSEIEALRKQLRDTQELAETFKRELASARGYSNQVAVLQQQLQQSQAQVAQLQAQPPTPAQGTMVDRTPQPTQPVTPARPSGSGSSTTPPPRGAADYRPAGGGNSPKPSGESGVTQKRTHTVQSGETLSMIAKRYGVKLPALQAANPRVDARRMKAGTVLNLPER